MEHTLQKTLLPSASCALWLALAMFSLVACRESGSSDANSMANNKSSANITSANTNAPPESGAPNVAKFDAEIAELEKQVEKTPGDDEVRNGLSRAYLRRANVLREAHDLKGAHRDYQSALRVNPDNEEAQQRAAEISEQTGEQNTGENGEPAPLPITPNITSTGESTDVQPTPTKTAATPKKKPESGQ